LAQCQKRSDEDYRLIFDGSCTSFLVGSIIVIS
jgi:hypothetical protein